MKKMKISKEEASKKYGCIITGPNQYYQYYLREDGVVVDNSGDVRYLPEGYIIQYQYGNKRVLLDEDGDVVIAKNILESLIAVLSFSVRTYNCLMRAGIRTVKELCSISELELMRTWGVGDKCICEVKEKLAEFGLALGYKDIIQDTNLYEEDKMTVLKHKKKFVVLIADNIDCDIRFKLFIDYGEAYRYMESEYDSVQEDVDNRIERQTISEYTASIMTDNGDLYYWNIKRIEC